MKRRNLLIIVLGITLLIVITFAATMLDSIIPHKPTTAVQIAQIGPYQVTLQVTPNPPHITQAADLTLQIARTDTRQLVTNARVTLESSMVSMDMGTDLENAQKQSNGSYLAHVQFGMSGTWQVRIVITIPGAQPGNVTFQITAQ